MKYHIPGNLKCVDRPTMARLLSISVRKLDEMRKDGLIPSLKMGGRRLYQPQAVYAACDQFREGK